MEFVRQLLLYTGITFSAFLMLGLYKPWIMLWWEDVQNRKKVIKLYGSTAAIAYFVYWIMGII